MLSVFWLARTLDAFSTRILISLKTKPVLNIVMFTYNIDIAIVAYFREGLAMLD